MACLAAPPRGEGGESSPYSGSLEIHFIPWIKKRRGHRPTYMLNEQLELHSFDVTWARPARISLITLPYFVLLAVCCSQPVLHCSSCTGAQLPTCRDFMTPCAVHEGQLFRRHTASGWPGQVCHYIIRPCPLLRDTSRRHVPYLCLQAQLTMRTGNLFKHVFFIAYLMR